MTSEVVSILYVGTLDGVGGIRVPLYLFSKTCMLRVNVEVRCWALLSEMLVEKWKSFEERGWTCLRSGLLTCHRKSFPRHVQWYRFGQVKND